METKYLAYKFYLYSLHPGSSSRGCQGSSRRGLPCGFHESFVLDDGGDEELQSFCDDLNVRDPGRVVFIRREKVKGVPHNFKCGNINNGLKYSEAEYVVMMDADMILHPSYLRRLLPHIVNSA